jgi:hypothetical protein
VKNCILNGNVFLGYDDATLRTNKYAIKTKDMLIAGFGSRCQYQASLHPSSIRFLPQVMIEQLVHEARGIQNNAFGSLAVTVIQLAFSSYKIFVAGGNSWGKHLGRLHGDDLTANPLSDSSAYSIDGI